MESLINKDTTLCMSLAGRPGNFGTRFHNYLYQALGLNYLYKAFTSDDLKAAIGGVRALGIRGCAISMPFKEQVIELVDEVNPSAAVIASVNTIVNDQGYLRAYNTDYLAIETLLKQYQVASSLSFAVHGSGGMAKAVVGALHERGFRQGVIVARNQQAGEKLAQQYGYRWVGCVEDVPAQTSLLINATPIGMKGGDEDSLAFPESLIQEAEVVFDVVAMSQVTALIAKAQDANKVIITGSEVFALQALEQFELYTGIRPSEELFKQAAQYAREGA